ncbi:MAG: phage head morphogenesis protein [Lachnospiraceae bacterium]|nr:phage head morphogenesis protein [Lachnospiraceae bacterium]MCD8196137.1 phage head morphogenesis protein [Lachnospiraceae bacterium]
MPPKRIVYKARSNRGRAALNRLNSFLDANNPRLARILVTIWKDQGDAITYKELREAIMNGYMSEATFQAWQQDYIKFFNESLSPVLSSACSIGSKEVAAALLSGADVYAPVASAIESWVQSHGAELVTRMTADGKEAISALIRYTTEGNMTVDELARAIRPTIGLTNPQAQANIRYYANIKAQLLENNPNMKDATAAKRAREASIRYAARQHRERAQMIAETELAWAYNKGADNAVKQAVADGLLPKMKAVWSTAADELVCATCGAMDGVAIDLGSDFYLPSGAVKTVPPAHPRCRCAVAYEEADD